MFDPDGNDVTADFVTVAIDPDDGDDVWDDAHADYVGDDATPENVGLFHNGTGAIAQKIKVPDDAEITVNSTDRRFRVDWKVKKANGFVTKIEYFNVDQAGVLVLDSSAVTVEEVKAGLSTSLSDPQITDLIAEATRAIRGRVEGKDVVWEDFTELPFLLRDAIIQWARWLIFSRDASSGLKVEKLKEGTKRVEFAGISSKDIEGYRVNAKDSLMEYLRDYAPRMQPRLSVATRKMTDTNPFE